jgi:hypothetical protein
LNRVHDTGRFVNDAARCRLYPETPVY